MPWETVKDVTLILFSVGALVIALWCLFFMVPVKRFMERIEALGGGLKGIEGHVEKVHSDLCQKLSEMETTMRQKVSQAEEKTQEAVDQAVEDGKKARSELDQLRRDLQSLQAELRKTARDSNEMTHSMETLTRRLSALQDEFASLDVKLEQSVKQRVAESFKDVEATVLSALDAIQEEMVGQPVMRTGQPSDGNTVQFPRRTRRKPGAKGNGEGDGDRMKIEPLFDNLGNERERPQPDAEDEEPEQEPDDGVTQTAEASEDATPQEDEEA
jgi:cytochrome c556